MSKKKQKAKKNTKQNQPVVPAQQNDKANTVVGKRAVDKKLLRRERMRRDSTERNLRWDKLDNTANLFPVIAGQATTNVYRISVTLSEPIVQEKLQEALDIVLPRFDGFNMRLRTGFFWYYFEENGKPAPKVVEEEKFPCRFIRANRNHSYLFRVSYYDCRINLEVFHVLTDGMGGINFLRELTYQYLRLIHPELGALGDSFSDQTSLNREDSFVHNYKKSMPRGFERKRALLIKGEKLPEGEFGLVHTYLPLAQLKEVTHRLGISINDYLVAVFAWSIYQEARSGRQAGRPIRIAVPVNLRPYYNSVTTKNFFVMVSAELLPGEREYSFEEVRTMICDSLHAQINKEHLEDLFSYSVSNQMNLGLRLVPLPIKGLAMRFVYNQSALANTTTMTNIGNIGVEEEYRPYIRRFHAFLAMSKGQNLKATICSYGDSLVVSFSTVLADAYVERAFVQQLAEDGIDVSVETNGVFYE